MVPPFRPLVRRATFCSCGDVGATEVYPEVMTPSQQPESIRVAIVEDQSEIREGLSELIDGTTGFRTTGVYSSMEDALAAIPDHVPHVALLHIALPAPPA